ncbi:MAG: hypothetical protein DI498_12975 [Paracoccus denitrificans]|nr:MAG: hypothetical protein DI498_12975 [Paracoccus denitrificans]PZO83162.1 MAG: hypothetical protein DI633_12975 [Paracoccus denitrificans]
MRQFFVTSFERVISALVVIMGIFILIAAFLSLGQPQGGILSFLFILVFGGVYLIIMAGFIYLQIAIQANTKRTADAVEALLARR